MAREKSDPLTSGNQHRVAFVFSRKMQYPPDIHDMKAYYLTQDMKKRGFNVNWVQIGGREKQWERDGIRFSVLRAPREGPLPEIFQLLRLVIFCAVRRIEVVYEDEWLFLRKKPKTRLMGQMMLRRLGVKVVLDQRDPYVDFEIASGELKDGSAEHRRLSLLRSLLLSQSDLIILPSEAYSVLYQSEGIPQSKVLGVFRGIDERKFKLQSKPVDTRLRLGLGTDLVIGWFGLMHSYRMIREIIVPLIQNLERDMPNSHVLIAGEGPLLNEFRAVQRSEAGRSFTMLGTVPYSELPDYFAACDVTICPVSTKFRFSTRSNWLKIAESVAVGTPCIATRTEIADRDFKGVKGVYWVDSNYPSFLNALRDFRQNRQTRQAEAEEQARHFEAFSIRNTIPKIVDRVLSLVQRN